MPALRGALLLIGIVAVLIGLVWLAEDLRIIPLLPDDGVEAPPWPVRGMASLAIGILMIFAARSMAKRPLP